MLEETQDREEIIERVAALDIGKAEVVVWVRVPSPTQPGRRAQEIVTYSTMTRSLLRLADRLRELGVTRVVMEATSDYWKPVVRHEAPGIVRPGSSSLTISIASSASVPHPHDAVTDALATVWDV